MCLFKFTLLILVLFVNWREGKNVGAVDSRPSLYTQQSGQILPFDHSLSALPRTHTNIKAANCRVPLKPCTILLQEVTYFLHEGSNSTETSKLWYFQLRSLDAYWKSRYVCNIFCLYLRIYFNISVLICAWRRLLLYSYTYPIIQHRFLQLGQCALYERD